MLCFHLFHVQVTFPLYELIVFLISGASKARVCVPQQALPPVHIPCRPLVSLSFLSFKYNGLANFHCISYVIGNINNVIIVSIQIIVAFF